MAEIPMSLVAKLGSLVVHVQEGAATGEPFDVSAAQAVVTDPEVVAWLATIDPVMLPEKRA